MGINKMEPLAYIYSKGGRKVPCKWNLMMAAILAGSVILPVIMENGTGLGRNGDGGPNLSGDRTDSLAISTDKTVYEPGEDVNIGSVITGKPTDGYRLDWSKTYPGARLQYKSGRIVSDGEYLYVIGTKTLAGSERDVQLIKMDKNGTESWNRTWSGEEEDFPMNIVIHNETIYIVGASADGIFPDPLFLLAYDTNGTELWNASWDGANIAWGTDLVAVGDAIYISGWALNPMTNNIDAILLKFNATLQDLEWSKKWGDAIDNYCDGITYLNNSLYMTVYDSESPGMTGFVKFDMNGNYGWEKNWTGGYDTSITTDGSEILIVGSMPVNRTDFSFLRVYSETGDLRYEKLYGEPGFVNYYSSVIVHNGIAYCTGTARNSTNDTSSDAVIMGYDIKTGAEVLNLTWGGPAEEQGNGVTIMGESDLYCAGVTKRFSQGTWDIFVLKYVNPSRLEDVRVSYEIKARSGQTHLDFSNATNSTGGASDSFTLPLNISEGDYDCTVSAEICGTVLKNSTSFKVVWPWSPVLTISSSNLSAFFLPGDFIALGAYTGYEYPPALANRQAPGINLTVDILAPNGTLLKTFNNLTDSTGWSGLSFPIPRTDSSGIHSARISGFEGLSREIQFNVLLPTKPGPLTQDPLKLDESRYIPVAPIVGTAAIGLITIGIAISATETGKFAFFVPIAPLYTRIRRDKALSHRVRHLIIGYLADNPGQHYNALKKALKLSNSVMVYHLLVLEREGFIKSQRDGTMKRFYTISIKTPETRKRTPEELDAAILAAVEKRPGMTHKDLMEHLVVGNDVVKYHTRKLVRARRLLSSKDGKMRVYFPLKK